MKPSEFEKFHLKVADAVVLAWENKPGGFSRGLGMRCWGHNRRTVKFDGSARMYGVNDPDLHYEGIDDDRVQLLFFWDRNGALTGMVINTVATAQVTDEQISFLLIFTMRPGRQSGRNMAKIFCVHSNRSGWRYYSGNHEYTYRRAEAAMLQKESRHGRSWQTGFSGQLMRFSFCAG